MTLLFSALSEFLSVPHQKAKNHRLNKTKSQSDDDDSSGDYDDSNIDDDEDEDENIIERASLSSDEVVTSKTNEQYSNVESAH